MRYEFTKDIETGNLTIDTEHRTLIKTVDDIMLSVSNGSGKESLKTSIDFLVNYTKKHFSNEEALQVKYNYPDMPNHILWHRAFEADIERVSQKIIEEGPTSLQVIELTKKINDLITHIKLKDKDLASHIAKS